MEAAVSNFTSPGDKVLVLTAGKFGERWVCLVKAFGCEPVVLSEPYGQTFPIGRVPGSTQSRSKAVYMQATETSTGVRHDVEAIARLLKGRRKRCWWWTRSPASAPRVSTWKAGHRHPHRRVAKGADDSSGPCLFSGQRTRLGADGDQHPAALLLRLRKERKSCGQGRKRLHARGSTRAVGAAWTTGEPGRRRLEKGGDVPVAEVLNSARCA